MEEDEFVLKPSKTKLSYPAYHEYTGNLPVLSTDFHRTLYVDAGETFQSGQATPYQTYTGNLPVLSKEFHSEGEGGIDKAWERCIDPLSKNDLWIHTNNEVLQWRKPTASSEGKEGLSWDAPTAPPPSIAELLPHSSVPRASTPSTAPEGPLPQHWIMAFDADTQKDYYFNTRTGASSWVRPGPGMDIKPEDRTADWEPHTDAGSGATYYTHRRTGESTWIKPMPGDLYDWESCADETSGSVYYFSPSRNQTVWEKPPALVPTPPRLSAGPPPTGGGAPPSLGGLGVTKALARPSVSRRLSTQPTRKQRLSSMVPSTKEQQQVIHKLLRLTAAEEDLLETVSPPDVSLPNEWEELEDLKTGRPVFINRHLGVSTWVRPNELWRKFTFAPAPEHQFGRSMKASVQPSVVATAPAFMSREGGSPSQQERWEAKLQDCEGPVAKRGGGLSLFGKKSWKSRYMVLRDGMLAYYKNKEAFTMQSRPLKDRYIDVHNFTVDPLNGDPMQFNLVPKESQAKAHQHDKKSQPPASRTFFFRTTRPAEKLKWLVSLGCTPVQVPGGGDMVYMVAPDENPPSNAEVLDAAAIVKAGGRISRALDLASSSPLPQSASTPMGKGKRKGRSPKVGKKKKAGESKASPK